METKETTVQEPQAFSDPPQADAHTGEHHHHHHSHHHGHHHGHHHRRHRLHFYQKMLIYCGVWLLVTLAACGVMWNIMQQYEAAQPWYTVEQYLGNLQQGDFYSILRSSSNVQNPYESAYDVAGLLSNQYRGQLTYQKLVRESTFESPVYVLQKGEDSVFKLTLERGGKTGFLGLVGYHVKDCEVLNPEWTTLHTLYLIYPRNASVQIGGIPLAGADKKTYAASPFFTDKDFTTCVIRDFLLLPTVKVTLNGVTLVGTGTWEQFYDYPKAHLQTLSIAAPAGASLTLGSIPVTDEYKTDKTVVVTDRFGGKAVLEVYAVDTVRSNLQLHAVLDGKELTVSEDAYTALPESLTCTAVLPEGASLYANGIPVTDAEVTDDRNAFSELFGGAAGAPAGTVYTVSGLYETPTFTAKIGDTELIAAEEDGVIFFTAPASEELQTLYANRAIAFMNAYLHYTTQGYVNTRGNLDAVLALTAYKSPLYNMLSGSYIGYYYIAPQKVKVELLTADTFVPYGSDAFTCEIHYSLVRNNFVGESAEKNTVRLAFIRTDGEFKPVSMTFSQS